MFFKIKETRRHMLPRYTWLNKNNIECITLADGEPNIIKFHLVSGKEFRADIDYLEAMVGYIGDIN